MEGRAKGLARSGLRRLERPSFVRGEYYSRDYASGNMSFPRRRESTGDLARTGELRQPARHVPAEPAHHILSVIARRSPGATDAAISPFGTLQSHSPGNGKRQDCRVVAPPSARSLLAMTAFRCSAIAGHAKRDAGITTISVRPSVATHYSIINSPRDSGTPAVKKMGAQPMRSFELKVFP
jgi:hypothetical protein